MIGAIVDPGTLSVQDRTQQLRGWEESRKRERFQVVFTLFPTFFSSFALASITYWAVRHWSDSFFAASASVISALIPLFAWLASYLQTWGSYVERRLEDIESKIDGRHPYYYTQEDLGSFAHQPLHERLQRIETIVSQKPLA